MNVLINCEESATVREAFAALGHNAWSCDILPSRIPGQHLQMDALEALHFMKWDLMIAHPPCTYLSVSGLHWNKRNPERAAKTEKALEFVRALLEIKTPGRPQAGDAVKR